MGRRAHDRGTLVASFSYGDDTAPALARLREIHGGTTAGIRHLIHAWWRAYLAAGGDPTQEELTSRFAEADADQTEARARELLHEAEQKREIAKGLRVIETTTAITEGRKFRSPEALLDHIWPTLELPQKQEHWRGFHAKLHKISFLNGFKTPAQQRAVLEAAHRRIDIERAGQTNLRALPRREPE